MRIGFVDCETTGISTEDVPITIGVVVVEVDDKGHGEPVDRWYGEQHPEVPIHPRAQRVHGRSRESLLGKSFDVAGLRAILESAEVLIAHNAAYDVRMIAKVVPSIRGYSWRCSYRQWVWPQLANKKLDTACEHFMIQRKPLHDSMDDAEVLWRVLSFRTGKTDRSSTYLKRLVSKPAFDTSPRERRPQQDYGYGLHDVSEVRLFSDSRPWYEPIVRTPIRRLGVFLFIMWLLTIIF